MTRQQESAKTLLKEHGLVFKSTNPIEHAPPTYQPVCGGCHHFDVLCLQEAIAHEFTKYEMALNAANKIIAEKADSAEVVQKETAQACMRIAEGEHYCPYNCVIEVATAIRQRFGIKE